MKSMSVAGVMRKGSLAIVLCISLLLSVWAAVASSRETFGISNNGFRMYFPTVMGPPRVIVLSKIMRVSVASDGTQANGHSYNPSISADGRFMAFESDASNLVPDDRNYYRDVFVHDRLTGQTTRVSKTANPSVYELDSKNPSISADGRFIAFESYSVGLVPQDTDSFRDVFLYDRLTGELSLVSVPSDDLPIVSGDEPSISGDGRYVVFSTSWDGVYIRDRQTNQTSMLPQSPDGMPPNAGSRNPVISENGHIVAFESLATNLAPGDPNTNFDIYVRDLLTGHISRLPLIGPEGLGQQYEFNSSISADGRYVAFMTNDENVVSNDDNGLWDVFVHDRQTGQTRLISVASNGTQSNGHSEEPSISADGRYVAFESSARNLDSLSELSQRLDIYVHDRWTGETRRISVTESGTLGNGFAQQPAISGNGRYVAYSSTSSNLVPNDTNDRFDIFVHDRIGP